MLRGVNMAADLVSDEVFSQAGPLPSRTHPAAMMYPGTSDVSTPSHPLHIRIPIISPHFHSPAKQGKAT